MKEVDRYRHTYQFKERGRIKSIISPPLYSLPPVEGKLRIFPLSVIHYKFVKLKVKIILFS